MGDRSLRDGAVRGDGAARAVARRAASLDAGARQQRPHRPAAQHGVRGQRDAVAPAADAGNAHHGLTRGHAGAALVHRVRGRLRDDPVRTAQAAAQGAAAVRLLPADRIRNDVAELRPGAARHRRGVRAAAPAPPAADDAGGGAGAGEPHERTGLHRGRRAGGGARGRAGAVGRKRERGERER